MLLFTLVDPRAMAHWLLAREGLPTDELVRLSGGYEQAVFAAGDVVVRASGAQRNPRELESAYAAALAIAAREPELVVAPIPLCDGMLVASRDGQTVSLWPRVRAECCDRNDRQVREEAARTLARLHHAAGGLDGPAARRDELMLEELPDALRDRRLEAWQQTRQSARLLIHGDFYPGNLLWGADTGRLAVIDWDEARIEDPARELSWAAWEFCHVEDGTDLDHGATAAFLQAYADQAGALPHGLPDDLLRWIRWHLAFEMGRALHARRTADADVDMDYWEAERAAFLRLARAGT